MEFRGIPDSLLDYPITRFALWDDAEIDALHARALNGDCNAINLMYLALVAHLAGNGAQRSTAALDRFKVKQQRRRGGNVKAAKLRKAKQQGTAPNSWMVPLFQAAYDWLRASAVTRASSKRIVRHNPARIGGKRLSDAAKQIAASKDIPEERRNLLTDGQAERFLSDLKPR